MHALCFLNSPLTGKPTDFQTFRYLVSQGANGDLTKMQRHCHNSQITRKGLSQIGGNTEINGLFLLVSL